jgi:hypothetical protein
LYGIRRNALGCASKGKYLGIRVIDSRHNEDFKNIGSVILAAKSHQAFDDLLNGDAGRWPIDSLEGFRGRPVKGRHDKVSAKHIASALFA